jgi:hypothetical protein
MERVRASMSSLRQTLTLAGAGAVVLGGLIYLFFRDLEGVSFILLAAGGVLLLVDIVISWRTVARAVFGRGGRYGVNTVVILAGVIAIAAVLNFTLYYLVNRTDPMGWLRADTTATKQSSISDQAENALSKLKEPVKVNAFFTTNTAAERAAWQDTLELLTEFRRRSTTQPFEIERIDPELEPNRAVELGVTNYPALAVVGRDTLRQEVIEGADPNSTTRVFTEPQLITALLVVSQERQKTVMFVSGHSERDILDGTNPEGYALALQALARENYSVLNVTLQELGSLLSTGDPTQLPAVLVIADPRQEFQDIELGALSEYARQGGSIMLLVEPGMSPAQIGEFLSLYGLATGQGELADTASFVAPNPLFLQLKRTNGQIPAHRITDGFDVLYFPEAAYLATTVSPDTVPVTSSGRPYVIHDILGTTTLRSWAELDDETIEFSDGVDTPGPLPVAIASEAISELTGTPRIVEGEFITTNIVLVGDADFASNAYFASAKNGDLLVNSVNWLARDFELISLRPKIDTFRELVLTQTERDFVRWTGWLLMPALIGLAGVWAWWVRR